ncbi:MAG: 3-phosphoshikimate 1-carboxyvinyltransferase [Clostridia bacterium]|nr:3-phosphoshikimate 1-carboxyvinyltransferase [Clostridia bacterium]
MTVDFLKSKAQGTVTAPPSKSYTHRALICASLSGGTVKNISLSQDALATLRALKTMGAQFVLKGNTVTFEKFDLKNASDGAVIDCLESASTLRFLIPIALLTGKQITFTGNKTLMTRPLDTYFDICKSQGIFFNKTETTLTLCGKLAPDEFYITDNISSQFVSGLMFALPLLSGDSEIIFKSSLGSMPYINLTANILKQFGINAEIYENKVFIKGGQTYVKNTVTVEGDYSSAAYFAALNLLGGKVTVTGLNKNSAEADKAYIEMFADLKNGKREFDLDNCIDLAPIMFALACFFKKVKFTGTKRLKYKESDRAVALKEELSKIGATITVLENEVTVECKEPKCPISPISSHNDHRIAMAMSILLSAIGGRIENTLCVSKSYPEFFEDLKHVGIEFNRKTDI